MSMGSSRWHWSILRALRRVEGGPTAAGESCTVGAWESEIPPAEPGPMVWHSQGTDTQSRESLPILLFTSSRPHPGVHGQEAK